MKNRTREDVVEQKNAVTCLQCEREDYESDRKKNENRTPKTSPGTDPIWTENDDVGGALPTAT